MKAILTSYLGGSIKAGGKRIPIPLMDENGQLDKIKAFWRENSKILLISGTPDDYGRNDGMINCLKESFRMSGLFYFSRSRSLSSSTCIHWRVIPFLVNERLPRSQRSFSISQFWTQMTAP